VTRSATPAFAPRPECARGPLPVGGVPRDRQRPRPESPAVGERPRQFVRVGVGVCVCVGVGVGVCVGVGVDVDGGQFGWRRLDDESRHPVPVRRADVRRGDARDDVPVGGGRDASVERAVDRRVGLASPRVSRPSPYSSRTQNYTHARAKRDPDGRPPVGRRPSFTPFVSVVLE
jgi:hypothetical protein